ncbi:TIGR00725 family protein [Thermotoga sp. KOL6]|uniref:TIGR00725 family protein n=1 Tax=Thermotoga sp. KOL6 TaxID=126741 RepID=UPI000C77F07D|nr:TIGR00725 family protein [Thermotoga sp. KOL6]PLV59806.1 hypothetical protein AS005_00435 [Thermotoga sp. KOL6]
MKKIGVIGYSGPIDKPPVLELKDLCLELGKRLARKGYVIFNGGRDGVMELVSRGAHEERGTVIGILPYKDHGNSYLSVAVRTGLDFQMRSFILLRNVDVVVSIGGEIGTAIEILGAYAMGKPVVLFRGTGGWTDRFSQVLIDGKYLDNRKIVEVFQAWTLDETLEIIEDLLPLS